MHLPERCTYFLGESQQENSVFHKELSVHCNKFDLLYRFNLFCNSCVFRYDIYEEDDGSTGTVGKPRSLVYLSPKTNYYVIKMLVLHVS